ncbi:effector-associated domain EAD1-containing protein [Stenotrophomonas sp.]|uniref:GAP1-N1 domain-containing protein n=1 Tax=Stenotrophomonas sp. TaxID=69392 RepID=UPI0028A6EB18|nr:effector-associated domain EAD1-containing protein [Stenotrophomonas sp.]
MRVDQAIYGEVEGRGHGLRGSSTDSPVAASVATLLDLPDSVPSDVLAWSPFVRGFPFESHYVLARTFIDSRSSRGGMVLTHALIVSLDDICQADDLVVLFESLVKSPDFFPAELSPLDIEVAAGASSPPTDLVGAANALTEQQGPVVWLGVAGFESLVAGLWRHLWPSMRQTFAFRLSFGPKDLQAQPGPVIVCTPEQLQARWLKHRVVNPADQTAQSPSAAVLCGQQDARPYLDLARELGLDAIAIKDLARLERLYSLITNVDSFDDLLKAVRLVDGLSNRSNLGRELKANLIELLVAKIPTASIKQMMPMRNLELPSFENAKALWAAVGLLVSKLDFAQTDDADLVALIEASSDSDLALPAWREAVMSGLSIAGRTTESGLWKAIWRWAELSNAAFKIAMAALPPDASSEALLVQAAPRRLDATKADAAASLLLKKGWLTAHGTALAALMPPRAAAEQQLKVDRNPDSRAGLQAALRYATYVEILQTTLDLKDERLVEMCGDLSVTHPKMLSGIRCTDLMEQKVWAAAIEKDNSLWSAPSNPVDARDHVLSQLSSGNAPLPALIEGLARTPLADLTAAPNRARLWSLLPACHRDLYLNATAKGWLNAAVSGDATTTPERELEEAVLTSSHLQVVLQGAAAPPKTSLAIVSALPSLHEEAFMIILNHLLRVNRSLPEADSIQLGVLLASRRWHRAIHHLCDLLASGRYDLTPALRQCADSISFFLRWKLGISKPSIADKWRALEEIACEFYPTGPDHDQLWSRAGGKNSDLLGQSQNGRTRWHAALRSLRYGGLLPVRDLLRVMCNDFSGSEKLSLLASDTDIVGWR